MTLTPGNTGDVTVAPALFAAAGSFSRLLADTAYDVNWLRVLLAEQGIEAVIPCNPRRKPLIPHDALAYTTCYNRFNRWRKAGVWDRLMDAIT